MTCKMTGLKYLRIFVSGKTGGRHLIASARVEQALLRFITSDDCNFEIDHGKNLYGQQSV